MSSLAYLDVVGERLHAHEDPTLAFMVGRLHLMMIHRGISTEELAAAAGRSRTYVAEVLNGKFNITKLTPEGYYRRVEALEDAVTTITDRRGGLPYACCGPIPYLTTYLMLKQGHRHLMRR